jgi:hydroxypyruvate isomerase
MNDQGLAYLANCSIMFTEHPLPRRPAAKAAGFDAIEFWWPWPDQPVPGDADADAFVRAVREAGVRLAGLNFFAGDLAGPDCGTLSIPARVGQFRLCDRFHLANNGDDLDAAIAKHAGVTSHVQIADWPGRGEPGSGRLDLDRYLTDLAGRGYAGWVGLEYKPTTDTETSLAWLPRQRRAARGQDLR